MKFKQKKLLALIMSLVVMFNINTFPVFAAPEDEEPAYPELLTNGDFSEDSWASDWNFTPTNAGETPVARVDGNFQLTSHWAPWPNTVYIEQTVETIAGATYLLKYSAKSNPARPLGLVVDNANTSIPIAFTDEFQEYTNEIVARNNQLTIRFQLGAAWINGAPVQYDQGTLQLATGAPTITFENISLKQIASEPSEPEPSDEPEETGTLEVPSVADARLDRAVSGNDIVLTFDSSANAYREAITGIYIDKEEVPASLYEIGANTITLDSSLFPVTSGDQNFRILIAAQDYRHQILYQSVSAEGKWTKTFEDNFDGAALDGTKWDYQNGMGRAADGTGNVGWGNNEQQFYTDDNVSVNGGELVITATKNRRTTPGYTTYYDSGKLRTKITQPDGKEGAPLFSQKYGRFEAKIKMPAGKSAGDDRYQGIWPAFWMMPTYNEYGGWANSGEIDIMEAKGRFPNNVGGAIHYGGNWPDNRYQSGDSEDIYEMDINDYHVYAVEWEEQAIRWYVDGVLYFTANSWYNNDNPSTFPAPFDKEFYLILNLAVGGIFDNGRVPEDSILPAEMKVDYVRAYQFGYEEPGDTTELQGIINEVDALDSTKYTPESWNALVVAIEAGKNIIASENASPQEVADAMAAIQTAMDSLSKAVVTPLITPSVTPVTPSVKPVTPSAKPVTPSVKPANVQKDIAKMAFSNIKAQAHSGKAIAPVLTIKDGNKVLNQNVDYTLAYSNNKNPGTAQIFITGKGIYTGSVTKTFAITASKGKTYTVGNYKYKVLNGSTKSGTVTLVKPVKKTLKTVKIPATIKIGNYKYKVTEIAKNAFKNNKKLKSVTIGKNVKKIGASAFYGNKALKKIIVQSKVIKTIGKNAFKGINSKATIKVPKAKLKAYKKTFAKKGQAASVTIKK